MMLYEKTIDSKSIFEEESIKIVEILEELKES